MTLTKHFNTKKMILTFVAVSILTLSIGCSNASKNQSQAPAPTQSQESIKPSPSVTYQQDQDLTKKLRSENIVQSGKVYLTGDKAIATITVKKGNVEKIIKELATKYANTMKQKYSDKKINVVAFMENKEVANILL